MAIGFSFCDWSYHEVTKSEAKDIWALLEEEGKLVEVEMWEEKTVEFPKACATSGVGPCLGLAVVDRKSQKTHLVHRSGNQEGDVNEFLDVALKNGTKDVLVAMVGVVEVPGKHSKELNDGLKKYAAHIRKELKDRGVKDKQIVDRILNSENRDRYMIIADPTKKKIYIASSDRWDGELEWAEFQDYEESPW